MANIEPKQLNVGEGANRFKYQSFNKRIEKIGITAGRRIQRDTQTLDENSTYFGEALDKWCDLNGTREFQNFSNSVSSYGKSLAQILYHKEEIINILLDSINADQDMSLEPLFDIATSLAKDLQAEFYPYYIPVLTAISKHVRSKHVETIEHSFNAIAFLFKYLQKQLSSDLRPTFDVLSPFLGAEKQKTHIRRFAAESLSFMIRKLKNDKLNVFVNHVFSSLENVVDSKRIEFMQGISLLFFETIKGVEKKLYSQSQTIFKALFAQIEHKINSELYKTVISNVFKMALHQSGNSLEAKPIWDLVSESIKSYSEKLINVEEHPKDTNSDQLENSINIYKDILILLATVASDGSVLRKGSRVCDHIGMLKSGELMMDVISALKNSEIKYTDLVQVLSVYLSSVFLHCPANYLVSSGKITLNKFLDLLKLTNQHFYGFEMMLILNKMNWPQFFTLGLPFLVNISNDCWKESPSNEPKTTQPNSIQVQTLVTWSHLIRFGAFDNVESKSVIQMDNGKINFFQKEPKNQTGNTVIGILNIIEGYENVNEKNLNCTTHNSIEETISSQISTIDLYSMCIRILEKSVVPFDTLSEKLFTLLNSVLNRILDPKITTPEKSYQDEIHCSDPKSIYSLCSLFGQIAGTLVSVIQNSFKTLSEKQQEQSVKKLLFLWDLLLSKALGIEKGKINESVKPNSVVEIMRINSVVLNSTKELIYTLRSLESIGSSSNQQQKLKNLVKSTKLFSSEFFYDSVLPALVNNVASFNKVVRKSSLDLVHAFATCSISEDSSPALSLLNSITSAEEAGISLVEYRNKINHVMRMVSIIFTNELNENLIKMSANLMVSYLGLNLSLIWKEMNKILLDSIKGGKNSKIMRKYVWSAIYKFVGHLYSINDKNDYNKDLEPGISRNATTWINNQLLKLESIEKTQKTNSLEGVRIDCPYNTKFRNIVDYYSILDEITSTGPIGDHIAIHGILCIEISGKYNVNSSPEKLVLPRIDYSNILVNVFNALTTMSELSSEHLVEIIRIFTRQMYWDWNTLIEDTKSNNEDSDNVAVKAGYNSVLIEKSRKVKNNRLYAMLSLLAKVSNIKKYDVVNKICLILITNGDPQTQKLALEVLLHLHRQKNSQEVIKHAEDLRNTLSNDIFKETLLNLKLNERFESENSSNYSNIPVSEMMEILLRLLYGKLVSRAGNKSNKTSMRVRRLVIFQTLASLVPKELDMFCDLILNQFGTAHESYSNLNLENCQLYLDRVKEIALKTKVGFLSLVQELVKQLGTKINPIFHKIITTTLLILGSSQQEITKYQSSMNIENDVEYEKGSINDPNVDNILENTVDSEINVEDDEETVIDNDSEDDEESGLVVEKDSIDEGDDMNIEENDLNEIDEEDYLDEDHVNYKHGDVLKLRQLAIRLLSTLITVHPEHARYPLEQYFEMINMFAFAPRIDKMRVENTQNESSLIELITSCTQYPDTIILVLQTNDLILPNLISILAAKSLSAVVTKKVLDILSRLLDLENIYKSKMVVNDKQETVRAAAIECTKKVLAQNASLIVSQSQIYLIANYKTIKTNSKILIQLVYILSHVSEYLTKESPKDLIMLLDLLIPFVSSDKNKNKAVVNEKTQVEILVLLNKFIPMLFSKDIVDSGLDLVGQFEKYFNLISKLFGRRPTNKDFRELLCEILSNLATYDMKQNEGSLVFVCDVIKNLNSYSQTRINEPDFDKRLSTFNDLNERWYCDSTLLNERSWLPLLYNLIYFSNDEDELSLRSNSGFGLTRFIEMVAAVNASFDTTSLYSELIEKVLWTEVLITLKSGSIIIKQDYIKLLGTLVSKLGSKTQIFGDLQVLLVEDEEASFFLNILHLQMHRRVRALTRFNSILETDGCFRQTTLHTLFLPFFESILFTTNRQAEHSLVAELITSLSQISKHLNFNNYINTIRRYMNKKKQDNERVMNRLIISTLQSFQFNLRDASSSEDLSSTKMLNQVDRFLLPQLKNYLSSTEKIHENPKGADESLSQRIPVSLAYVKILTLCPKETMDKHLPPLLTIMCNLLKARSQETRDTTRNTLSKILGLLGPNYFGFLVSSLETTLQKGFMRHVLTFTLHFLLSNNEFPAGSIDYTMKVLINIFVKDMFDASKGDYKSQNNAYKEIRSKNNKSLASFEILASTIRISNLAMLLVPLIEILDVTDDLNSIKSVKTCLHHIATGLVKNKDLLPVNRKTLNMVEIQENVVDDKSDDYQNEDSKEARVELGEGLDYDEEENDEGIKTENLLKDSVNKLYSSNILLLKYIFSLIHNHLFNNSSKNKDIENRNKDRLRKDSLQIEEVPIKSHLRTNAHCVVEFGLQTLLSMFKLSLIPVSPKNLTPEFETELLKFVDLVGNCLFSNHDNVMHLSLRIYGVLIKLKAGTLLTKSEMKIIINRCFQLLKKAPDSKSPLSISCLQLISTILKVQKPIEKVASIEQSNVSDLLNKSQLDHLVSLIKPDLESEEFQSATFSLLIGILNNKLISTDLYDLIDNNIQSLLIKSYSKFVRKQCQASLLKFYLNYPISQQRLTNLLNFILMNINGYELQSGRESGLEFMNTLVIELPESLIVNSYDQIFVSLVMALINESEQKLVEMISILIKKLVRKMDVANLTSSFDLVFQWLQPDVAIQDNNEMDENSTSNYQKKLLLWKASLQILGLVVESCIEDGQQKGKSVLVEFLSSHFQQIIQFVYHTLAVSVYKWKKNEDNQKSTFLGSDFEDTATFELWQHSYLALKLLERLYKMEQFNEFLDTMSNSSGSTVVLHLMVTWQLVVAHLTYPHTWNRMLSTRLVGLYFSVNRNVSEDKMLLVMKSKLMPIGKITDLDEKVVELLEDKKLLNRFESKKQNPTFILLNFTILIQIAYLSTVQLNSANLNDEHGSQIVKNLFFIAKTFLPLADHELIEDYNLNDTNHNGKSVSKKGNSNDQEEDKNKENEIEREGEDFEDMIEKHHFNAFDPESISYEYGLLWLLRRAIRVANYELIKHSKSTIRRKTVFQLLAATVSVINREILPKYVKMMVLPVYRTISIDTKSLGKFRNNNEYDLSGVDGSSSYIDLLELSNQFVDLLKQLVGSEKFNVIYNQLNLESYNRKQNRKVQSQQLKLADPQKYAMIKESRNQNKKRKKTSRNAELSSKKVRHVFDVRVKK
ncbi:hypothetical protein BB558_004115 [Smittium angustum]|uniref:Uncharacterized protein n=1 Tax=Smittium angustum TaxID=133377 RepID=A0A2U1J477_SMIAN|nr:hypothetical protein BB558_004115 [Smittium angustum]